VDTQWEVSMEHLGFLFCIGVLPCAKYEGVLDLAFPVTSPKLLCKNL